MSKAVGNFGDGIIVAVPNNTFDSGVLGWANGPSGTAKDGMPMWPFGWQAFQFTLYIGASTGYNITCYGTADPFTANGTHTGTAANWFKLPAPSVETAADTNAWGNPLTNTNPALYVKALLCAVRIVASGTVTGTCSVGISVAP